VRKVYSVRSFPPSSVPKRYEREEVPIVRSLTSVWRWHSKRRWCRVVRLVRGVEGGVKSGVGGCESSLQGQ
jgi:hypothetical protein